MRYPIVAEHFDVHGEVSGRRVAVSALEGVARYLLSVGANQVLVPVPGDLEKDRVARGLASLPSPRRRLVKTVDANAQVLRRVREYLNPLRLQAEKWPETAFVGFAEDMLYHMALACKYGAIVAGSRLQTVQSFLPIIEPTTFGDEAGFRLSEIGFIATRYEPFLVDEPAVVGQTARPGVQELIRDALDTAEFEAVAAASGRIGLLRHPKAGIRRLSHAVRRLVRKRGFKAALRAGTIVSEVATWPISLKPLEGLAGSLERGHRFSPLVMTIPIQLEYDVSLVALMEHDPKASPPRGVLMSLEYHRAGSAIHEWLNEEDRDKLRADPRKVLMSLKKTAEEARLARNRLRLEPT